MRSMAVLAALIFAHGVLSSPIWVYAQQQSCHLVCDKVHRTAVYSGYDSRTMTEFFVCSADIASVGARAGFNMRPYYANRCVVGSGGVQVDSANYSCLCD